MQAYLLELLPMIIKPHQSSFSRTERKAIGWHPQISRVV